MATGGCIETMELLNLVFTTSLILNDGHEIFDRLRAGDDVADIVEDVAKKFGREARTEEIRAVTRSWPALHVEAVAEVVRWALGKLDTEDRITINWKGDADHPETVTRLEFRGNNLMIEFAHPPVAVMA
jgi:hypothetical protein